MNKRGFSQSGTLAKQRAGILDHLSSGLVRDVEEKIVGSLLLPPTLKSHCKLQAVHEGTTKIEASFGPENGETISKKFSNLKLACDWLNERVAQNSGTTPPLPSSSLGGLKPVGSESVPEKALQDVTASFLSSEQQEVSVPLPGSTVCLHKGSVHWMSNRGRQCPETVAIFLGKEAWNGKFHCTNMVHSDSTTIASLLETEALKKYCKIHKVVPCGAFTTSKGDASADKAMEVLKPLGGNFNTPFLLQVDLQEHVPKKGLIFWELVPDENSCKQVSIQFVTMPHDFTKRFTYNACDVENLGVSELQRAIDKIVSAVLSSTLSRHKKSSSFGSKTIFTMIQVPPDGYRGWHCLNAARNLQQYLKVPRQKSGFAVNRQVLDQEASSAKKLHSETCQKAFYEGRDSERASILQVLSNPAFDPAALEWVSRSCGMSIRCTCCPEARFTLACSMFIV